MVRGLAESSASSSFEDDPTHISHRQHAPKRSRSHIALPPKLAAPSKLAAFSRSADISRSLSRRAFSLGSRTASSSYSMASPLCARAAALAASLSASLALSVPFFLGAATGAAGFFSSSSSSSEDSSQSLCMDVSSVDRWRGGAYSGRRFVLVLALPLALDWFGGGLRRACGGTCVVRVFCATVSSVVEMRERMRTYPSRTWSLSEWCGSKEGLP